MIDREDLKIMFSKNSPGSYEKLSRSTVGIAGAGGLGSNIAHLLVRAGIGRLIIDDPDRVELTNLGRQLYTIDQLGKPKVLALKEYLLKINPFAKIEVYQVRLNESNVSTVFIGVDLLIEALDSREAKINLIRGFSKVYPEIPIIVASGVGGYGKNDKIKTKRGGNYLWTIGDFKTEPDKGLMAPRVSLVAAAQANLSIEILMGDIDLSGKKITHNFRIVGGG